MELSLEDLRDVQGFLAQCDPSVPLRGASSPLYEPLDQGIRGSQRHSIVRDLERTIQRSQGATDNATCQLFTGFQGTGKTTELHRLKELLQDDKLTPTHVVFVNFEDYIDLYSPISITDVLRVLAYVLDREASDQEAQAERKTLDPQNIGYLKRFFDFIAQLDATIKQIGFSGYGASLMLEIRNNPNFRKSVIQALDKRFQQFADEAKQHIDECITRLRKVTHARRIVLIADSLEKLTYIHENDREAAEAAAETVFVTHASLLRLNVHVIYTFPFWLRFRAPQIGGLFHNEPRILPMVKIHTAEGEPHLPGIQALGRLVDRRMPLSRVFGDDTRQTQTLLPLVEASGGFPRDLLRMIRNLLQTTDSLPVTPEDCKSTIDGLAQTYERAVRASDADMLVEIAKTHAIPDADRADVAAFSRLFGQHFVLGYMNGEEWYDLHPLVRRARTIRKRLEGPVT